LTLISKIAIFVITSAYIECQQKELLVSGCERLNKNITITLLP
jgi:hypothetical protein